MPFECIDEISMYPRSGPAAGRRGSALLPCAELELCLGIEAGREALIKQPGTEAPAPRCSLLSVYQKRRAIFLDLAGQ